MLLIFFRFKLTEKRRETIFMFCFLKVELVFYMWNLNHIVYLHIRVRNWMLYFFSDILRKQIFIALWDDVAYKELKNHVCIHRHNISHNVIVKC